MSSGCLDIVRSMVASHHRSVQGPWQQFRTGDDCDRRFSQCPGSGLLTGIAVICLDLGFPKSCPCELQCEQLPQEWISKRNSRGANACSHSFHFHCGMTEYSVMIISLCNMLSPWSNVHPHSDSETSPWILIGDQSQNESPTSSYVCLSINPRELPLFLSFSLKTHHEVQIYKYNEASYCFL